jgi:hypothetical protein
MSTARADRTDGNIAGGRPGERELVPWFGVGRSTVYGALACSSSEHNDRP